MVRSVSVLALCAAIMTSGCASVGGPASLTSTIAQTPRGAPAWTPSIDTKGVNQAKYAKDYAECQAYALGDPTTNGKDAAKKSAMTWGLGTAALLGAGIVMTGGLAALPVFAGSAAVAGGTNALAGGVAAKTMADAKYRNIVASCLQGRGYTVLN